MHNVCMYLFVWVCLLMDVKVYALDTASTVTLIPSWKK